LGSIWLQLAALGLLKSEHRAESLTGASIGDSAVWESNSNKRRFGLEVVFLLFSLSLFPFPLFLSSFQFHSVISPSLLKYRKVAQDRGNSSFLFFFFEQKKHQLV
jgi:hypothetical protein